MAVANSIRADSDVGCGMFLWCDLDQTGAEHSIDDLRNVELSEDETFRDLVEASLAVDDREHLPLAREEVDERFRAVVERRESGNHACIGNLVGHARPL